MSPAIAARCASAFVVAALLSNCAPRPSPDAMAPCPAGQGSPMAAYELFFGRNIGTGGEVGDAAWAGFVAQVVTPNLPDGYTVFDGNGYWRNPANGQQVAERTKILLAAVADTAGNAAAVQRIRAAYARRFHQHAVGLTVTRLCGAF
jgi:hypothetical protein